MTAGSMTRRWNERLIATLTDAACQVWGEGSPPPDLGGPGGSARRPVGHRRQAPVMTTHRRRRFSFPPQSGQASSFGRYVCTSRGRCSGSGRRAGRVTALSAADVSRSSHSLLRLSSSSTSRSSSCSIWRPTFSDELPNCRRRSLAISSFRCSISASREASCSFWVRILSSCVVSCWCCATISAFNSRASRASRSGSVAREATMRKVCQQ